MATIKLEIVTPDNVVFSQEVEMVEAPAIDGLIGVLPDHAPLVTALKIGVLKIRTRKDEEIEEKLIPVDEGFMEVRPDQVNVVVRTAELPENIDIEKQEKTRKEAEKDLEAGGSDLDIETIKNRLKKSEAWIKAYEDYNKDF